MTRRRKKGLIVAAVAAAAVVALAIPGALVMFMPGRSHAGPLAPLTADQARIRDELRRHVEALAGTIGERNIYRPAALARAAEYIEIELTSAATRGGRASGAVRRQGYRIGGTACDNIELEVRGGGREAEIVIVGAHYDSVAGCPGANDNASGVAALLVLADRLAGTRPDRTLRFVAFVNEEPPHFWTGDMGSLVYARACKRRGDNVVAMISLETIGFYSDEPGSQMYPFPFSLFYPSRGDFIAFVGNIASRRLVRRCVSSFRGHAAFPSEGIAAPALVPQAGWSDHWAFWEQGWPALMVTDTAPFRYPHYHTPQDTPEKINYERTARVVEGLSRVVEELVSPAR